MNNKQISIRYIKWTDEKDKKNTKSRYLTKITDIHIYPDHFQKMNVKLAAQIFSNFMSAAIKTCIATKVLSSTAENKANFNLFVNNIFDCLNSRKPVWMCLIR